MLLLNAKPLSLLMIQRWEGAKVKQVRRPAQVIIHCFRDYKSLGDGRTFLMNLLSLTFSILSFAK
jgi:hypothetical protein